MGKNLIKCVEVWQSKLTMEFNLAFVYPRLVTKLEWGDFFLQFSPYLYDLKGMFWRAGHSEDVLEGSDTKASLRMFS